MKRNFSLWLAALLALLFFSCNKDILNEEFVDEQSGLYKQNFNVYQWSEKESNFFSLNPNRNSSSLDMRNEEYPTIYHPLLVEAYNEIARQNEIHGFVSDIATKAGYPDWARSYVFKNSDKQENLVIIPLLFDNQNKLSGLIIASKQINSAGSSWSINGMSREELLSAQQGNPLYKGAITRWMLSYERRHYSSENEALKTAYNLYKTRGHDESIVNSPQFNPPQNCEWRILEICSDDETQISWQAGVDAIPPHLDHDRDGILNQNDQDWYDLLQRYNITQAQFTQIIDSWWEDNYQDQYGDYADFWEDIGSDQYGGGQDFFDFINEIWDTLKDVYNDIFDDGIFWPDLDNQVDPYQPGDWPSGDGGGSLGDPFTSGGEIGFRDVRCYYYYMQDCGTGAAGWWKFTEWITCPNCTEQDIENENQWFYIRLNAYIDYFRLEKYRDLLLSITANVPVLLSEDEVFRLFSTAFLDHFLDQHPGIALSSDERKWLLGRPGIIGALWEHSAISGQGDVSEQGLEVIVSLCIELNLNELEAVWLIQDAHLHGSESTSIRVTDYLSSHGLEFQLSAKEASRIYIRLISTDTEFAEFKEEYEELPMWWWPFVKEIAKEAILELLKRRVSGSIAGLPQDLIQAIDAISSGDILGALGEALDIAKRFFPVLQGVDAFFDGVELIGDGSRAWRAISKLRQFGDDVIQNVLTVVRNRAGGLLGKFKWAGNAQGIEVLGISGGQAFDFFMDFVNLTPGATQGNNPSQPNNIIFNAPGGLSIEYQPTSSTTGTPSIALRKGAYTVKIRLKP